MAESNCSFSRVFLLVLIELTTVLITIATNHTTKPWMFTNETYYDVKSKSPSDTDFDHIEDSGYRGTTENVAFQENPSSLLLVHVLFRHGDRAPSTFYPTDPHKDDWPFGVGQLTQRGMKQGYHLGEFLRHSYRNLLGDKFDLKKVYIRSSDVDRTIISAECVASGLFPGHFSTNSWPLGRWQPIPIHTVPLKIDKVLSPSSVCKYVEDLRNGLLAFYDSKQKLLQDEDLMFQLSSHTQMEMNFTSLHQLSDNIYCLKVHNMSLPSWLTKDMEEKLIAHHFTRPSFVEEQARLLSGMLLKEILSSMHEKINDSQDQHKMYLYSGHDLNIQALMSLLKVHNNGMIPYASAFIMELHELNSHYYVKFLYKTEDDKPHVSLFLPGCGNKLCPLDKFEKLYGVSIQEDWDQVCDQNIHERLIDFGEQTVPILISLLVFLLVMDIILLYKACLYHSKLQRMPYKEEYSLVQTQTDSNDDEEEEMEIISDNLNHNFHIQNGGGTVKHVKKEKQEVFHQNIKNGLYFKM